MNVLRGMPVTAAAVRLPRERAGIAGQDTASPQAVFEAARAEGRSQGLEQGRQEGWRQGHEEGLAAGRAEAARELEARAAQAVAQAVAQATAALGEQQARLAAIGEGLAAARDAVLDAAEDDLVALAFEMFTRLVADTALQPQTVRAMLAAVLAGARRQQRVLLGLHPEDAQLLDGCGLQSDAGQGVAWRADSQVALGGCLVESAGGSLDLRLETLLADCRDALLRAREERRAAKEEAAA